MEKWPILTIDTIKNENYGEQEVRVFGDGSGCYVDARRQSMGGNWKERDLRGGGAVIPSS